MILFRKNSNTVTETERIKQRLLEFDNISFKKYYIETAVFIDSEMNKALNGSLQIAVLAMPLKKEEFWVFRQELCEVIGQPVAIYSQDDRLELVNMMREQGEVIYEKGSQ